MATGENVGRLGPTSNLSHALVTATGGTTGRSLAERAGDVVNLLDFGADSTGATASDAAMIAAMNAAWKSPDYARNRLIYLPAGEYLFASDSLLNLWTAPTAQRRGVAIAGDGWFVTTVRFRPPTAGAYLYDGVSVPGRRLAHVTMRDFRLVLDSSAAGGAVNGFRQNGVAPNPDQAFEFHRMRVEGSVSFPGTLLRIEGAANGSENKLVASRVRDLISGISCANAQAVNHYSIGTDWEGIAGPLFDFEAGGNLTVFGGSIIFSNANGANPSLLRVSAAQPNTAPFTFYGVRTEVRLPGVILYDVRGTAPVVGAQLCSHRTAQHPFTLARMESFSRGQVYFRQCDLNGDHDRSVEFVNAAGTANWFASWGGAGTVALEDCQVRDDLLSSVTWGANAQGGLFRTRRSRPSGASVTFDTPALATDVDMTGDAGWTSGRHANAVHVKTVSGYVHRWPSSTAGTEARGRVILPAGSIVKAIRVRKAASGGSTFSYQLAVTNGDGSHTYGTSTLAQRKDQHDVMLENVNRHVAAAGVDQEIRVTATAGNFGDGTSQAMGPGDMFIVEYY